METRKQQVDSAACARLCRAGIIAANDWNRWSAKPASRCHWPGFIRCNGIIHSPPSSRSPLKRPTSDSNAWPAKMKPIADQVRRMLPFGSPKRGRLARPNEARDRRRRVVQVDPRHGETDARAPRQGRGWGSVAAPASRVHGRPGIAGLHPAAGRASRGPLNGFPGALAGVLRRRIGGGWRRLSDTSPTGLSDARLAGEPPAYPGYNPGAGEGLRPFDPRLARAPVDCAGGGVAPLPPVAAQPDG